MQGIITFLGTGASAGVPVIGCDCKRCCSSIKENQRLRTSILIQLCNKNILVDAGPEFRLQALREKLSHLDAFILTHTHFDHIAGIDDIRIFAFKQKGLIPCFLSQESFNELKIRYHYLLQQPQNKDSWIQHIDFKILSEKRGNIDLFGQDTRYFSYLQGNMVVNGFKMNRFAYVTDISHYPETIFEDLLGTEILVLSALREGSSLVHFNLDQACKFSEKVGARQTYLTHLSHDLDYEETNLKLPANIRLAYDGLKIPFDMV